jgi:hypothetical protein
MSFIKNEDISGNLKIIDFMSKTSDQIMNKKYFFSNANLTEYTFKFNLTNEMKNTNFTIQFFFSSDSKVTKFQISDKEYSFYEIDESTETIKYLKQICDVNVDSNLNFIILSTIKIYN